ncbi:MAG: HugZ family protein [Rhizobiaceae bacterium]|nr:MAG: HugZ family protein [Rhizobiaceae bacterium]
MTAAAKKDVIQETDAEAIRLAKTLIRTARYGALATLDPKSGAPMATRVAVATDMDGTPLTLVSGLSAHTVALLADNRCSLLLGEPDKGDPLAYPRISLFCRAKRLERGSPEQRRAERRYLNRNPKAKLYAGFPDFSLLRLEIEHASLNGGFAKAYHLENTEILIPEDAMGELAEKEQSAISHMNEEHADAVERYATTLAHAEKGRWVLTGIDPDGFDIASGDKVRRIFFPRQVRDMNEVRGILVKLAGGPPEN